MRRATLLLVFLVFAWTADAATIHVPSDQPTIQAGVNAAAPGDTVLVACGTYTESGIDVPVGLVLLAEAAACVTIDLQGSSANAFLVENLADRFQMIGMRVIHAEGGAPDKGAVIVRNSTSSFVDCEFVDHVYRGPGDAIHIEDSDVELLRCRFANITHPGTNSRGTSVEVASHRLTAADCVWEFNAGGTGYGFAGGALELGPESVGVLEGCVIRENFGHDTGGAVTLHGALTATGCTFEDNGTTLPLARGGALYGWGASIDFVDCVFRRNTAGLAAGLFLYSSNASIRGCSFEQNEATSTGAPNGAGAYFSGPGSYSVMDSRFDQNTRAGVVSRNGASTTVTESLFSANAIAGVVNWEADLTVDRCTIVSDALSNGALLYFESSTLVRNSIIAFNTSSVACVIGSPSVTVECTDIYGNENGDWVLCLEGLDGVDGNFSADPLFCDPSQNDYTLQADSPCAPPGLTNCGLIGALPVGCGIVSIRETSWAKIKSLYR